MMSSISARVGRALRWPALEQEALRTGCVWHPPSDMIQSGVIMEKGNRQAQVRLQAIVRGRVQGVSYRFYTQRRARELGLNGYVRNLWNGDVEVVVEGSRPQAEEFLDFLRVGPRAAFVTEVEVQWPAPTGTFLRFEVRY